KTSTPQARAALRRALSDVHPRVRLEAANSLHRHVSRGDGSSLLIAADVLRRAEDDQAWSAAGEPRRGMGGKAGAGAAYARREPGGRSPEGGRGRPGRRAEAARALQRVLPREEFDRRVFPKVVAFLRDTEDRDEASTFLWVVRGMGPRARKAGPVVVKHLRALE